MGRNGTRLLTARSLTVRRRFALRESRLYYYKSEDDSVPINFIDMKDAVVQEPGDPAKHNDFGLKFQIVVEKRIYRLKCTDIDDAKRWISTLVAATSVYNESIKRASFRLSVARQPVRIVESGTVDVEKVERERKELEAAEEQRRAEREREAAAKAEEERAQKAVEQRAAAAERKAAEEARLAAQEKAGQADGDALNRSNDEVDAEKVVASQGDGGAAAESAARGGEAAGVRDESAAPPTEGGDSASQPKHSEDVQRERERQQALAERAEKAQLEKKKPVKESVVGAWPSFDIEYKAPDAKGRDKASTSATSKPTGTAASASSTAAAVAGNKKGKREAASDAKSSKAIEKLESELAARERELDKEKLSAAAMGEQVRVLTLERDQMAEEFEPLVGKLSKLEKENAALVTAAAARDAELAQMRAAMAQLQQREEQARAAQTDSARAAAQLSERLRVLEGSGAKKMSKVSVVFCFGLFASSIARIIFKIFSWCAG